MLKHKKWLAGLLSVVMLFGLTACGGSKETPAETTADEFRLKGFFCLQVVDISNFDLQ